MYDLIADVQKQYGVDGGYTYSLALKDNKTAKASPAIARKNAATYAAGKALTNPSVAQDSGSVNPNFSLKEDGPVYDAVQLDRQMSGLKEMLAEYQKEKP